MEVLHWLAEHPFSALVWMDLTMLAVLVASWLASECWQESRIIGGVITAVAAVITVLCVVYWDFVAVNWASLLIFTVIGGLLLIFLVGFIALYVGLWFESKVKAIVATALLMLISPFIAGLSMWVYSWDWIWIFYNASMIFLVVVGGLFVLVAMFIGAGSGGVVREPYCDKFNKEMAKNAQIVHAKRTGLIP